MGKGFNPDDYVDVHERIARFYGDHPEGSIRTDLDRLDAGLVIFKATVYRAPDDAAPSTGWAYEREGEGYVNKTSFIENCETSAIGRAIANAGVDVGPNRPSREEMQKANRGQQQPSTNGRAASDKQLALIAKMKDSHHLTDKQRAGLEKRLGNGMSKEGASDAIEWLIARIADGEAREKLGKLCDATDPDALDEDGQQQLRANAALALDADADPDDVQAGIEWLEGGAEAAT